MVFFLIEMSVLCGTGEVGVARDSNIPRETFTAPAILRSTALTSVHRGTSTTRLVPCLIMSVGLIRRVFGTAAVEAVSTSV